MRTAILVVLLASSGCYGAAFDHTSVPAPPIEAQGGKVSQYCTFNGTTDVLALNAFLREQGERGWQLVGVGGQTATLYCFRFVPGSPGVAPIAERTDPSRERYDVARE
jgi:hypothetical protein